MLPAVSLLGRLDAGHQPRRHSFAAPDETHPGAALVQIGHLRLDGVDEEVHELLDLARRPRPVLAGEGEDRDLLDAEVEGMLEHATQRLDPGAVTGGHGKVTARRPPPVAVHDDGQVAATGAAGRPLGRAAAPAQSDVAPDAPEDGVRPAAHDV